MTSHPRTTSRSERETRPDRIQVDLRAPFHMPRKDLLTRFLFGAVVSAVAAVVSKLAGPFAGGFFLAFPAILLASLTLVAKEEGGRAARDDARGAALGTLGLIGFALVAAALLTHRTAWLALGVATIVWAAVSLAAYAIARAAGHGADEPRPEK
jgi:uncharacterized membrane protein (GlpM family)